MAIRGWAGEKEAALYTKAADRKRVSPIEIAETWQERRDSNPQPPVLETGALAN
jgi:hypothetical protein